jgi:hypothetical protein
MEVLPATPAPIEAFLRSAELQLAALLVALVIVPGALDHYDSEGAGSVRATRDAPKSGSGKARRGRHVRPPRSC